MKQAFFAAILAAAGPVGAHAQASGDALLQNGMSGRISQLSNGVAIERVGGRPDAGYFLVRLIDNLSAEAATCPKKAFEKGQGKRWRQLNNSIYDLVFKRSGLWGINAEFAVSNPSGQPTRQEIRLVSVKDPHKSACVPQVMGANGAGETPKFVFITPINVNDHVYGTEMPVHLKSVHQMETDKDRIDALWRGLGFFAKVVSAPLAPLVDSFAGEGRKETEKALTEVGGEAYATRVFKADPGGATTQSEFLYLGFESFGQKEPATLTGGVTLQGDYQASVLVAPTRYLSDIAAAPTPESVLAATPFRNNGVYQTVRDRLGAKANNLADQTSADAFSGSCTGLRPDLLALGLSEIDADLWLWAMARKSSHAAVSQKLDRIGCFGAIARANLKRVGNIEIEKEVIVVETVPAGFEAMQAAMANLGTMAAQGAINRDLLGRFASQIDVSIADDELMASAGALNGGDRDRAAVLDFLVRTFGRYGCYAPRDDRTQLALRPYMPLPTNGRAAAMMMHTKGGTPYVVTFGFDGVPKNEVDPKAQVTAIAIQKQGNDTGDVVRDLARGTSEICPKIAAH